MCRSRRTFFGLSSKYIEKEIYETFFYMKMFGGWSFIEFYNLPLGLRRWFVEKLSKHLEEEAKQMKKARG